MVDAVLIHPPTILDPALAAKNFISAPLVHYGYGMLYLGSFLIKNGYSVKVWNIPELYQWGFGEEVINRSTFDDLHGRPPILFGIELNWMHQSRGAIELAERLREIYPETPIFMGGVHASLFAREIISEYSHCVSGVVRGEAELPFLEILARIEDGKSSDDVSGLTWNKRGKVVENPITRILEDIDEAPPYSPKKLGVNNSFVVPAVNILRGPCSMQCIYCIGPRINRLFGRKRMTYHSPDWIVNQVSILIEEDFSRLFFQDYFWCSGRRRLLSIAKALQRERVNEELTYFNITSAPGFLDCEVLEEFSRAGVDNIDYGVESGSERVLKLVRRNVTPSQIMDAVKAAAERGIIPNTFWMVGFPGETEEDLMETARVLKKTVELGGVPRWVTPLVIVPRTELYDNPKRFGVRLLVKSFKDYMSFSNTVHNPNAWYPELVTHETDRFNAQEILKMAFLLRMLIRRGADDVLEKAKANQETYAAYHPYLNHQELEKRVSASISVTQGSFW
ncbi:MAG: B12-binding domain-containing radical SAM protein [Candidatus Bathyarchaeia archaeon]